MSEVNIAATEHEENTVAERGETVSMHERLREYARFTPYTLNGAPRTVTSYVISESDLDAIQEAIEAPWRERIQRQALAIAEEREEHDALKARADALAEQCRAANDYVRGLSRLPTLAEGIVERALAAYDAADRAGETQDDTTGPNAGSGDVDAGGDGGAGHRDCDPDDVGAAPAGEDRRPGAGSGVAPSPTDAAGECPDCDGDGMAREPLGQHMDACPTCHGSGMRGGGPPRRRRMPPSLLAHDRQLADLEHWREGVDEWRDDADAWRRRVDANMEHLTYSTEHLILRHQREDGLVDAIDALRGPEVTPAMWIAGWEAFDEARCKDLTPMDMFLIGLNAALRAGGAK